MWVLTLSGSKSRQVHMRRLLHERLKLPRSVVTFVHGASCAHWAHWKHPALLQRRHAARQTHDWWLPERTCIGNERQRGCLQTRYTQCLGIPSNGSLPTVCNELCYTLSVVLALEAFLARETVQRALILEDDVCPTTALPSPSSLSSLNWLGAHTARWDLVKLGDCYRIGGSMRGRRMSSAIRGHSRRPSVARRQAQRSALSAGTCAEGSSSRQTWLTRNNTILQRLPLALCSHALALSRRAATYLVAEAFPVSDVFDSLLISHVSAQQHVHGLLLRSVDQSLFAQLGKVRPHGFVRAELASQSHAAAEL